MGRRRRRGHHRLLSVVVGTVVGMVVVLAVVVTLLTTGPEKPNPDTVTPAATTRTTPDGHRTTGTTTRTTVTTGTTATDVTANPVFAPLLPTARSPLRVLDIGDSLGIDLGDQLQARLDATGRATTTMASVGDSGLSNSAFYDWPAELATLLASEKPQIVVVFLGANDDQGLLRNGVAAAPGSPAWAAAYAERVDEILHEATEAGARVVWVGMPPMENADLNAAMTTENTIFKDQTDSMPGTLYLSSASVLATASGLYQTTGPGSSGQTVVLRTPDGVHLTPDGAGLLAATVIGAIDTRWDLSLTPPPSPSSALRP